MSIGKRTKGTRELVVKILGDHPDWNARQVYDRYLILIGDARKAVTLNAVQKCIQELKPILKELKETGLDEPWNLRESIKHGISPQSTPALLKAWRSCIALDDKLSIREAKWISYLSSITTDTGWLLFWAEKYASWEKNHTIMFGEFDSIDLDAYITMNFWENATASLLGKVDPIYGPDTGVAPSPNFEILNNTDDSYNTASIAEYRALNKIYLGSSDLGKPTPPKSYDYTSELSLLKDLNFESYQLWIYAHWLTALSKGPEWRKMERYQIIEMINYLRSWIMNLPTIKAKILESAEKFTENNQPIPYGALAYRQELIPKKLVYKAGFKPDKPDNYPGDWNAMVKKDDNFQKNMYKLKSKDNNKKSYSSEEDNK